MADVFDPAVLNCGALPLATLDAMPSEPKGRALLEGATCICGDAIRSGDLVAANFDVKHVHTGGGLYLLEAWNDNRVTWRGCR